MPICILCLYYWCLAIISLRITFPATKVTHSHIVTTPTYDLRSLYVTPIVYDSSGQRPEVKAWPLVDSVWQSISEPPPNMPPPGWSRGPIGGSSKGLVHEGSAMRKHCRGKIGKKGLIYWPHFPPKISTNFFPHIFGWGSLFFPRFVVFYDPPVCLDVSSLWAATRFAEDGEEVVVATLRAGASVGLRGMPTGRRDRCALATLCSTNYHGRTGDWFPKFVGLIFFSLATHLRKN